MIDAEVESEQLRTGEAATLRPDLTSFQSQIH